MIRQYLDSDYNFVCALGRDIDINYIFRLNDVSKCFVYELNNEVIGFIIVDIFSDRAELIDICVSLIYRNKGIGNQLLNYVVELCKNNNCDNLTLEVKCDNEPAIKLYKNNSFKIVSIRKKYYNNGKIDAFLMYRKL